MAARGGRVGFGEASLLREEEVEEVGLSGFVESLESWRLDARTLEVGFGGRAKEVSKGLGS